MCFKDDYLLTATIPMCDLTGLPDAELGAQLTILLIEGGGNVHI